MCPTFNKVASHRHILYIGRLAVNGIVWEAHNEKKNYSAFAISVG